MSSVADNWISGKAWLWSSNELSARIRLLLIGRCGRRALWAYAEGRHANSPGITLADINRRKIASHLVRATVLALEEKRTTPFSIFPDDIAINAYRMRRDWVVLGITTEVTYFLELVRIIFFDSLPTVNWSCVIHQNSVFGVESGHGGCIALEECLVGLLTNRVKLLNNLWIDGGVFFLAKGR
jgi:hypothetical protein